MVLVHLAPGTISTMAIAVPTVVPVARQVFQINNDNSKQFFITMERANLIIRLEKLELAPYGLKVPANTLISLPPPPYIFNKTLEYNTDIVEFHHNVIGKPHPSSTHQAYLFLLQGKYGILISSLVVRVRQGQVCSMIGK